MMKRFASLVVAGVLMVACSEGATLTSPSLTPGSSLRTSAPVEACTGKSSCSLPTPVVTATPVVDGVITVSWASVTGGLYVADQYSVSCDVVNALSTCTGGGSVREKEAVNGMLTTTVTVVGDGPFHVSVKAHGHEGGNQGANGQNSLKGWATVDGTDIDICAGSCTIVPPTMLHVHVDLTCHDVTYNGHEQTPCSATVSATDMTSEAVSAISYSENVNAGTATAIATYAGNSTHYAGADTTTFEIAKAPVTATGGSAAGLYTGLALSASACTVTGSYTGNLSCDNDPASAGPNVGSTATTAVILGTDLENYDIKYVAGAITITPATLTATAYTGARTFGQANPATCTVSGAVNNEVYGCTSSSTATGSSTVGTSFPTAATMIPNAGLVNYDVQYVGGALNVISYDVGGCFIAPIFSAMSQTNKAPQKKGSTLPIKCPIKSTTGYVTNATGTFVIHDVTAGVSTANDISGSYKLTAGSPPLYMNQQDTSTKFYVAGHQYTVTSVWNDGVSTTTGYFTVSAK